jgi:hypothetical protein
MQRQQRLRAVQLNEEGLITLSERIPKRELVSRHANYGYPESISDHPATTSTNHDWFELQNLKLCAGVFACIRGVST